jgi:hypothetical protein
MGHFSGEGEEAQDRVWWQPKLHVKPQPHKSENIRQRALPGVKFSACVLVVAFPQPDYDSTKK